MKMYAQAPLPFQGQKRRFLNKFKEALISFPSDATYVDLFGGSGLLSHTVKSFYPSANVIWNDYDNYHNRLDSIEDTNNLIAEIRLLLNGLPRDKKIEESIKNTILSICQRYDHVDYITLSSNILFSGKYAKSFDDLCKETFYNVVRQSNYSAGGYLVGVQRVSADYKTIFSQYKNTANAIFLVDPPYLSTDTKSYNSDDYWKLRDYLDVINVLDGSSYFYFTSNKSQIVELCNWIETRSYHGNPFKNATVATTAGAVNYNSSYTDIMIFKKTTVK